MTMKTWQQRQNIEKRCQPLVKWNAKKILHYKCDYVHTVTSLPYLNLIVPASCSFARNIYRAKRQVQKL